MEAALAVAEVQVAEVVAVAVEEAVDVAADAAGVAVAEEANQKQQETWQSLPNLGVGLGFREPYHSDVFLNRPSIDFLEIVADHFFDNTPYKSDQLALLQRNFPLVPHGLGLSLGSADGLDRSYLLQLAKVVHQIDPPWWSEHIAFTRAGDIDIGHLTSLPRSKESLAVLRENIKIAKDHLPYPLILENITHSIQYPNQEYDEAAFLGQVLEENECGLLLDVTNLYINSVNHRFDPIQVLQQLPRQRIVQLHFVGGHWDDGMLLDSHSTKTPPEIWQLLEEVVRYADVKAILLERDENLPPIHELLEELQKAREILIRCKAK